MPRTVFQTALLLKFQTTSNSTPIQPSALLRIQLYTPDAYYAVKEREREKGSLRSLKHKIHKTGKHDDLAQAKTTVQSTQGVNGYGDPLCVRSSGVLRSKHMADATEAETFQHEDSRSKSSLSSVVTVARSHQQPDCGAQNTRFPVSPATCVTTQISTILVALPAADLPLQTYDSDAPLVHDARIVVNNRLHLQDNSPIVQQQEAAADRMDLAVAHKPDNVSRHSGTVSYTPAASLPTSSQSGLEIAVGSITSTPRKVNDGSALLEDLFNLHIPATNACPLSRSLQAQTMTEHET